MDILSQAGLAATSHLRRVWFEGQMRCLQVTPIDRGTCSKYVALLFLALMCLIPKPRKRVFKPRKAQIS